MYPRHLKKKLAFKVILQKKLQARQYWQARDVKKHDFWANFRREIRTILILHF